MKNKLKRESKKDIIKAENEKSRQECINAMGKDIEKMLNGTSGIEDIKDFVNLVIEYNILDTAPELLSQQPEVKFEVMEGKNKSDQGFLMTSSNLKYLDTLWINPLRYDTKELQKDPQLIVDLICTISHEIRHWYQRREDLEKIEKNIDDLVLSGKDDEFFEQASKSYTTQRQLQALDMFKMYRNASREEMLYDIQLLLRMNPEDVLTGVLPDGDSKKLGKISQMSDDKLRWFLACKIDWAEYVSLNVELDARLTGTAETVNIMGDLKQSENFATKAWADKFDIHKFIQNNVNNERSNIWHAETYENFKKNVPAKRLASLMENIPNEDVYNVFSDNILKSRKEEEVVKLISLAIAKGNFCVSKEDIGKVPQDILMNIFNSGACADFDGNRVEVEEGGYEILTKTLYDKFEERDLINKAQQLVLEGKFDSANVLVKLRKEGGLLGHRKFMAELRKTAGNNIDKMFQFVRNGTAKEKDLKDFLSLDIKEKYAQNLNEARFNYINNIKGRALNTNNMNTRFFSSLMLSNLSLISQEIDSFGENLDSQTIESYFKLTDQYINTLTHLVEKQRNFLNDNDKKKFDKARNNPGINDVYKEYQENKELFNSKLNNLEKNKEDDINFIIEANELLGTLREKIEGQKEIFIIDENENSLDSEEEHEEENVQEEDVIKNEANVEEESQKSPDEQENPSNKNDNSKSQSSDQEKDEEDLFEC